jgi:folate-binding protein YgfZ
MSTKATATFDEQYQALRGGCGVVELANWSSVGVTGADRYSFLHNFCTNDIKRLRPGESCEAFFANVKGKIVGHGIVSCRENELVTVGVPGQSPALIAHLDRYLIREDVQLRDTTNERRYVLIAGGRTECEDKLAGQDFAASALIRIPCNLVGSAFEELIELSPRDLPKLLASLQSLGAVLAGSAFYSARIEAGIPLFLVDFDGNNLPQEVGRDKEAISFTKGCYLGQETIARIDALGHVNQRSVGVRFFGENDIEPEMELTRDGVSVGNVSSCAFSPQLSAPLALAMVRREANAAGTRLDSSAGECEVIPLPLPRD